MLKRYSDRLAAVGNLCGRPTLEGHPCGQARRYNWSLEEADLIRPTDLPACGKHATPAERTAVDALRVSRQAAAYRRWMGLS